jgi:hypothetical protein
MLRRRRRLPRRSGCSGGARIATPSSTSLTENEYLMRMSAESASSWRALSTQAEPLPEDPDHWRCCVRDERLQRTVGRDRLNTGGVSDHQIPIGEPPVGVVFVTDRPAKQTSRALSDRIDRARLGQLARVQWSACHVLGSIVTGSLVE